MIPNPKFDPAEDKPPGWKASSAFDPVNYPEHYNDHPSGVPIIELREPLPATLSDVVKYVFRYKKKGGAESLRKAVWYLRRFRLRPRPVLLSNEELAVFAKVIRFGTKFEGAILGWVVTISLINRDHMAVGRLIELILERVEEELVKLEQKEEG